MPLNLVDNLVLFLALGVGVLLLAAIRGIAYAMLFLVQKVWRSVDPKRDSDRVALAALIPVVILVGLAFMVRVGKGEASVSLPVYYLQNLIESLYQK